jgi:hypothetical protein
MANLYGAYRGAGKAGAAYASSLQDIMNVGYEKEHSKQMFDIGQEQSGRAFAFGQQALGLVSTFAGGEAEQEEDAASIKKAYGDKVEQTYGETKIFDLLNPFKMGDDMTWAGRAKWLGGTGENIKWEGFGGAPGLGKGETAWGEAAERLNVLYGGKSREWTLEEGVGGIEAGVHKQSDLLPAAKYSLYGESSLNNYGDEKKEELLKAGVCPSGWEKDAAGVCYDPYNQDWMAGTSIDEEE